MSLVESKCRALLTSGAVAIVSVDAVQVVATVAGYHGVYDVRWHLGAGWRCSCPERRGACSHLAAVRRVMPATDGAGGGR